MKKIVNVYPRSYIYGLSVPILSTCLGIELTTGDIRAALSKGATVDEVLGKNKTVRLNYSNYDKDNSGNAKAPAKASAPASTVTNVSTPKPDTKTVSDVKSNVVNSKPAPASSLSKPQVETKNTVKDSPSVIIDNISQVTPDSIKKAQQTLKNIKK